MNYFNFVKNKELLKNLKGILLNKNVKSTISKALAVLLVFNLATSRESEVKNEKINTTSISTTKENTESISRVLSTLLKNAEKEGLIVSDYDNLVLVRDVKNKNLHEFRLNDNTVIVNTILSNGEHVVNSLSLNQNFNIDNILSLKPTKEIVKSKEVPMEETEEEINEELIEEKLEVLNEYNSSNSYLTNEDLSIMENAIKKDANLSIEEKAKFICEVTDMDDYMWDVFASIIESECKEGDYADAYAVASNLFSRYISYEWTRSAKNSLHVDTVTPYHIATSPGQYEVYCDKNVQRYKLFLGVRDGNAYRALVECIYASLFDDANLLHTNLSFRSSWTNYNGHQYVPRGNKYANNLKEEDTIPLQERAYYQNMKEYFDEYSNKPIINQKYTLVME